MIPMVTHHPVVKPDGPGVRTRWYECACGGPWPCEKAKEEEERPDRHILKGPLRDPEELLWYCPICGRDKSCSHRPGEGGEE